MIAKLLVFFAPLLALAFSQDDLGCPADYYSIADKCYTFFETRTSWYNANQECKDTRSNLASVTTQQQFDGLLQHINANYPGQFWTSGKTLNGEWRWATGEALNYNWWGRTPSYADDKCNFFCSITHKYWDKRCSANYPFICEVENEIFNYAVDNEVDLSSFERRGS